MAQGEDCSGAGPMGVVVTRLQRTLREATVLVQDQSSYLVIVSDKGQ